MVGNSEYPIQVSHSSDITLQRFRPAYELLAVDRGQRVADGPQGDLLDIGEHGDHVQDIGSTVDHWIQRRVQQHAAINIELGAALHGWEDTGDGGRAQDSDRPEIIRHVVIFKEPHLTHLPVGRRDHQFFLRTTDLGKPHRVVYEVSERIKDDESGEVNQLRHPLYQRLPCCHQADGPLDSVPGQSGTIIDQIIEGPERVQGEAEQARTQAQHARQELDDVRQRRNQEMERMREALSRIAPTRKTPLGMVVELADDSFKFDFDQAVIRSENREMLSRIAGVLLASQGYRLSVYGHTDDVGTKEYNQTLSERRAQAVADYLIKAGVPSDILSTKGYGKSSPRVTGMTTDARQRNRRVEIGIVDTIIEYQQSLPAR